MPACTRVRTVLAHDDPLTANTTTMAATTAALSLPRKIRIHYERPIEVAHTRDRERDVERDGRRPRRSVCAG